MQSGSKAHRCAGEDVVDLSLDGLISTEATLGGVLITVARLLGSSSPHTVVTPPLGSCLKLPSVGLA